MPNSGNAGDSLISVGVMSCFDRLGIRFKPITVETDVRDKVVILGGGGNFVPAYATIRNAFLSFKNSAKAIVLLPHTIRGNEDVLNDLNSNVTIICRDIESYRHVSRHCHKPTVLLGHDMAFHIDVQEFTNDKENIAKFQPEFTAKIREKGIDLPGLMRKPQVFFARGDDERAGSIGGSDLDPSSLFEFGVWPGNAQKSSWCFLEMIRCMQEITTDRLHIAIASALLEKPCNLFDNSYGKNAEVYVHSLKYHSSKIKMQGSATPPNKG